MDQTKFNEQEIENNLQKIKHFLNKEYLSKVTEDYAVYPFSDYNCQIEETKRERINIYNNIGCIKVSLWIKNKEEHLIDQFKNIFASFEHSGKTVAFAINRQYEKADFFFFVKTEISDQTEVLMYRSLLESAIKGNFPGSKIEIIDTVDEESGEVNPVFSELFDNSLRNKPEEKKDNLDSSIAVVNAIATEKSEKFISQGLEKLIDGVLPKKDQSYSIIFIAESLTQSEISLVKKGFEDLTSAITPYIQYQTTAGTSSTKSESSTKSLSHSHGVNESIAKTHGWGLNVSGTVGGSTTVGLSGTAAVGVGVLGIVSGSISSSISTSQTVSYSTTVGHHQNWSKTNTKGFSDTDTTGESTGKILTDGITESTTLTNVSAELKNYSKLLEKEMELMDVGKALGLWKSAAYVLAPTKEETINIANFLKALIQGEKSILEPASVTIWSNNENKSVFSNVKQYISYFTHPLLFNKNDYLNLLEQSDIDEEGNPKNKNVKCDIALLTITNYVTTKELAAQMCFPQKAVPGMSVIDCVPFGREVINLVSESDRKIELGKIYHMHQSETKSVKLDLNSFTSHIFVTGSTGVGKSNTVYQILRKAKSNGVKFLVVEPAKGEYKSVFGKESEVHVYGSNPKKSKLLKLNPFSFNVKTTMLHEHIDRLIAIFNVCWPMYAAMPAVLKQAVEKSYTDCGWDLSNPWAENEFDNNYFPGFADVARNVVDIINSSDYDSENKGAYKGSLVTRLTSLTNGFFGMIFSKDEISSKDLFDENVILDLSHVGSAETKSLLMGIVMLKLQEYRMGSEKINSNLNHLTVLEEAHNLLKRTSTDMSPESGNLQGRSVEMISNAIAEMRTYGEGFIIADQAPGLLDMAAIRNTNTKIIMRLPDYDDRRLVGKAANLSEDQIDELARLPTGVAAIYQNNWVQSVLCQIEKFSPDKDCSCLEENKPSSENLKKRGECVLNLFNHVPVAPALLNEMKITDSLKVSILNYQKTYENHPITIGKIVTQLLPEGELKFRQLIDSHVSAEEWGSNIYHSILCYFNDNTEDALLSKILQSIMETIINKGNIRETALQEWKAYKEHLSSM